MAKGAFNPSIPGKIREDDEGAVGPGCYQPNLNYVMKRSPAQSMGSKKDGHNKSIKNYMETFVHKILSPTYE